MRVIQAGVLALSLLLSACMNSPVADTPAREALILQGWSGDFPIAALSGLPEGQRGSRVGYLASPEAFRAAWSAFRPGEAVPQVDFSKNLVVFVRNVDFYNRTNIFDLRLEDGVLDVLTMETMSALPIEDKAAMAMAVVPRQGVKFIQSGSTRISVVPEP